MGEDSRQEPREQQDEVDLSRFTMNLVEGDDTDRPAEKPKSAIWLVAVVVVGLLLIGAYVALREGGLGEGLLARRGQPDRAQAFLSSLRQDPALKTYLQDAEFIDQHRLKIVFGEMASAPAAPPQAGGPPAGQEPQVAVAPRLLSQQKIEDLLRVATGAFARYQPDHDLTVHAFQAGTQVAAGLYDAQTRKVTVVPPLPLPGESIGGTFQGAAPGGP